MARGNSKDRDQEQPSVDEQKPPRRRSGDSHVVLPGSSPAGAVVAAFMSRMAPMLRANLVRYGLGEDDAEDVVQEVFVRALAYRAGFPTARDFARWATIVGRNLAYDRLRELERVEPSEIEPSVLPDPAEEVEQAADAAALLRAYESLSASDRRVLYEAANDLRPVGEDERTRFRVWLSRARARLRTRMHGGLIGVLSRLRNPWEIESVLPCLGGALLVIGLAAGTAPPASSAPDRSPPAHRAMKVPTDSPLGIERIFSLLPPTETERPAAHPTAVSASEELPTTEPGRVTYERVEVGPPGGGQLVAVDTHERETKDQPLLCLSNMPLVGTRCVDK